MFKGCSLLFLSRIKSCTRVTNKITSTLMREFHKMEVLSRNKTWCQWLGFFYLRTWRTFSLSTPEWVATAAHKSLMMLRQSSGHSKHSYENVWNTGEKVCQDHSHVVMRSGCLRSLFLGPSYGHYYSTGFLLPWSLPRKWSTGPPCTWIIKSICFSQCQGRAWVNFWAQGFLFQEHFCLFIADSTSNFPSPHSPGNLF